MAEINDTVIPSTTGGKFFIDLRNKEYEGNLFSLKRETGSITAHAINGNYLYSLNVILETKVYTLTISQGDKDAKRMVISPSDLAEVTVSMEKEEPKEPEEKPIYHVEVQITTMTDCATIKFSTQGKRVLDEPFEAEFYDHDTYYDSQGVKHGPDFELAALEVDTF